VTASVWIVGDSHSWTLLGWREHAGRGLLVRDVPHRGATLNGLGVSGATAHNLASERSATDAGPAIVRALDSAAVPKRVLVCCGEVDCSSHLGRHGLDVEGSVALTVGRYVRFLERLLARPDVTRLAVLSTVPHHPGFGARDAAELHRVSLLWNSALRSALPPGVGFADAYTPLAGPDGTLGPGTTLTDRTGERRPQENHLSPDLRPMLLDLALAALGLTDARA
jgi:hypothetical protein